MQIKVSLRHTQIGTKNGKKKKEKTTAQKQCEANRRIQKAKIKTEQKQRQQINKKKKRDPYSRNRFILPICVAKHTHNLSITLIRPAALEEYQRQRVENKNSRKLNKIPSRSPSPEKKEFFPVFKSQRTPRTVCKSAEAEEKKNLK